jgi:hypothetical protein
MGNLGVIKSWLHPTCSQGVIRTRYTTDLPATSSDQKAGVACGMTRMMIARAWYQLADEYIDRRTGRGTVDVGSLLRASREPLPTRLCRDARGRYGSVRQES